MTATKIKYPDDRQGQWLRIDQNEVPGGVPDGIFCVQSGTEYFKKVIDGAVRAAQCGIYGNGLDMTEKINLALAHPEVHELVFDTYGASIVVSGEVKVPSGKILKFRNNCRLTGTGTLNGGIIECYHQKACFGTDLNVKNLENNDISICWFGAKADFNLLQSKFTDNAPMVNKALKARKDCIKDTMFSYRARVHIPASTETAKTYYCSTTIHINEVVELYGDGMYQSQLSFPLNTVGMIAHYHKQGVVGTDVVYLHDFSVRCAYPQDDYTDHKSHGLYIQGNSSRLERVEAFGFKGDGFLIEGAVPNSNANNCILISCRANVNGASGYRLEGSDGNNITLINCDATHNAIWGFHDSSFLGNTYVGCHASTNGVNHPWCPATAHYNGKQYIAIRDNVNIEPEVSPDWQRYWNFFANYAEPSKVFRPWSSSFQYKGGGAWYFETTAQEGCAVGCYAEIDQNMGVNDGNNLILGGFLAQMTEGAAGSMMRGGSTVSAKHWETLDRTSQVRVSMRGEGYNSLCFYDYSQGMNGFGFKYAPAYKGILIDQGNTGQSYTRFLSNLSNPDYVGRTGPLKYGSIYTESLFLADPDTDRGRLFGSRKSVPRSGEHAAGDFYFNVDTSKRNILGWLCTATGAPGTWKAILAEGAPADVADAGNLQINAAEGCEHRILLTGSRTIAAAANGADGQRIRIRLKQDGTGGHTVTWDSRYRFSETLPSPALSTAANSTDYLEFVCNGSDGTWDCVSFIKGMR